MAQWRLVISVEPLGIALFEYGDKLVVGQLQVAVRGIEEYLVIDPFSFMVGETIAAVGGGIRHESVKQARSGDYQVFAVIAFHDTTRVVLALVVDFSCSHFEFLVMPLLRMFGSSSG